MRSLLIYIICLLFGLSTAVLVVSCANPGGGPDGGPFDETPPRIVSLVPAQGSRNVSTKRMVLTFSEAIKVEGMQDKVVSSPPCKEPPTITAFGKRITIAFPDTLQPATTYTVDFSDAIVDATEANPLGPFTYCFSTGEDLDTMQISGHVLDAATLNPMKGFLVGLHSCLADSAFTALPLERVARTDASGYFSIKGVPADRDYRIYALQDQDQDYRLTRGESLAFRDSTVRPSAFLDLRRDTLWRDSVFYDSIRITPYTHYLPDDIVLFAFQEKPTYHGLLKTRRDEPNRISLIFTAPQPEMPRFTALNFTDEGRTLWHRSEHYDTLTIWLTDTALVNQDTLRYEMQYLCTNDSTYEEYQRTDTLEFTPRFSYERRRALAEKEREKFEKQREKRHKRGDYSQETMPVEPLNLKWRISSTLPPDRNPYFLLDEPAAQVDTSKIRLLLGHTETLPPPPDKPDALPRDTIIYLPTNYLLEGDTLQPGSHYTLRAEWRPKQKYMLEVDSAAVLGYDGRCNKKKSSKFSVADVEEFGSLFLLLPEADTTAVVQLIADDKKVYRWQRVKNHRADFFYLEPGTYYVRLFNDRNHNARIDPGRYAEHEHPEEVYYNPNTFNIRAGWDIEQTWRHTDLPATAQKPAALRQAAATKRASNAHQRNLQRKR